MRMHPLSSPSTEDAPSAEDYSQEEQVAVQDLWGRFIRGEQLSDDDYDEYEPSSRSRSTSLESLSSLSDSAEHDNQVEAVRLYADITSTVTTPTSASHLLAHLVDPSPSPLTRRRFNRLVPAPSTEADSADGWDEVMRARRPSTVSRSEESLEELRRNCVICTVEPRQIICWPCR
ncbi:hypothetical protein JVU11DRAFT_845 [Chiua virens]|nr:hypothetical protein JVU11DRAFT_845 [Chiua virens]